MKNDFLKVAKQAALEAGKVIKKYSGKYGEENIKGGDKSNFATIADTEAENVIIKILTSSFPTHNIIAEESGIKNKKSEYTWVIDPLDGTIVFKAGLPFFVVSIGLMKDNVPIIGVIYQVLTDELYFAQKGKGAYLNSEKIKVSQTNDMEEVMLAADFGHNKGRQIKFNNFVAPLMNKVSYVYSLGSDAFLMALLAKGIFDVFATDAYVWDFVAGAVIVREAGGKVTNFEGNEPDWSKERLSIVASNGAIHDQILEALNSK